MEAEYLRGTTGKGIDDSDAGPEAGDVVGGKQVSFDTPAIGEFMREVAENELAQGSNVCRIRRSAATEYLTVR